MVTLAGSPPNRAMVSLGRFQPSPMRAFHTYILRHQEKLQEMARGGMN